MEKDNESGIMGSSQIEGSDNENSKSSHVQNVADQDATRERGLTPVRSGPPEPTVLTLQDLLDIPRQILPEETYYHLKNAGREAVLAVLSLANSINNARRESGSGKTRKHINVE